MTTQLSTTNLTKTHADPTSTVSMRALTEIAGKVPVIRSGGDKSGLSLPRATADLLTVCTIHVSAGPIHVSANCSAPQLLAPRLLCVLSAAARVERKELPE
jgi:hypothetical protein